MKTTKLSLAGLATIGALALGPKAIAAQQCTVAKSGATVFVDRLNANGSTRSDPIGITDLDGATNSSQGHVGYERKIAVGSGTKKLQIYETHGAQISGSNITVDDQGRYMIDLTAFHQDKKAKTLELDLDVTNKVALQSMNPDGQIYDKNGKKCTTTTLPVQLTLYKLGATPAVQSNYSKAQIDNMHKELKRLTAEGAEKHANRIAELQNQLDDHNERISELEFFADSVRNANKPAPTQTDNQTAIDNKYQTTLSAGLGIISTSGSTETGFGYGNHFGQKQDEAKTPMVFSAAIPITSGKGSDKRVVAMLQGNVLMGAEYNFTETGRNGNQPTEAQKKNDFSNVNLSATYMVVPWAGIRAEFNKQSNDYEELIIQNGAELPKWSNNPIVNTNTYSLGVVGGPAWLNAGVSITNEKRDRDIINSASGITAHVNLNGQYADKKIPLRIAASYSALKGPQVEGPDGKRDATSNRLQVAASTAPFSFDLGTIEIAPEIGLWYRKQTDTHGAKMQSTITVPYAAVQLKF